MMTEKHKKYIEIINCYPGCLSQVRVTYDFGNPVEKEHFEKARDIYKSGKYYHSESAFLKEQKTKRNSLIIKARQMGMTVSLLNELIEAKKILDEFADRILKSYKRGE